MKSDKVRSLCNELVKRLPENERRNLGLKQGERYTTAKYDNDHLLKRITMMDYTVSPVKLMGFLDICYYDTENSGRIANISLAVDLDYRQRGLGKKMVREAIKYLKHYSQIHKGDKSKEFAQIQYACRSINRASNRIAITTGWTLHKELSAPGWNVYLYEKLYKHNRQMFEDYDEFDDFFQDMIDIIEEDQNDHMPTKSNGSFTGAKTPRELSNWMKANIRYTQFKKLESAEEVYHYKKGSCHDQVMFELHELSAMGYRPHAIFLIEYREGSNRGGMTHSFVYYKDKTGWVCWFENAWSTNAGIYKFNSIHDIKRYFENAYKNKKFGNYNKFGNLKFSSFGKHKPGESLDTFVRICLS